MRAALICIFVVAALLVSFEGGIRHVQPDTVVFTQTDGNGHALLRGTITDPARAQRWYRTMFAGTPVNSICYHCNGFNEAPLNPDLESYDFMRAGIEVAHVEGWPFVCGNVQLVEYAVNSGGLQDWNLYQSNAPAITPQSA
jgi:hypothetical protein